eukprot:12399607-Ditylum_brightwellii.AAC.1
MASKMRGSAGPLGLEAVALSNWLLRFGVASEELREEMAQLADWLANRSPPWAAYHALMACRLVALDKSPGTRPVGIGEIIRRMAAKMVIRATGGEAKVACDNIQLCAGLEAGIEGAVHAVRMRRAQRQAELAEERRREAAEQERGDGDGDEEEEEVDGTAPMGTKELIVDDETLGEEEEERT